MADGSRPGEAAETDRRALDRLVFFSDAVFAIAITLLVVPLMDVRLPEQDLASHLLALWPQVFSFVLSFVVIGLFWIGHHRAFQAIVSIDRRLMMLNLLELLCVAFLPFPTAVLGDHGDTSAATALYAVSMTLLGLASAALWRYASHGYRLIRPDLDPRAIRLLTLRSVLIPAMFAPSAAVALVSPVAAKVMWLLTFPLSAALDRWGARVTPRSPNR